MKVAFFTLGCKVNLYETEVVINQFKSKGYKITDFNDVADIYIINTCTVTNTSDQKSRKMIRQAIGRNKKAVIAVMGCYSQIESEKLEEIEGIDIIIGNKDKSKIIDYIEEVYLIKKKIKRIYSLAESVFEDMELDNFETKTRAFIKIQDGCNSYCSYCIIPFVRGPVRSRKKENILKEINSLVTKGYLEIVLTGIHIGKYGSDFNNYYLSDLLKDILKNEKIKRVRISSIEINEIDNSVLELLKTEKVIANHLHIPIQSGSDEILTKMNRQYNTEIVIAKIKKIREIRPDIAITTDIIVGFPTETDEDFNKTYFIAEKIGFSDIHIFSYSKRNKTKAATMPNHIDKIVKKERITKLNSLRKKLQQNYMKKFIEKEVFVIPETYNKGYLIGYSSNYLKVKYKGKKEEIGNLTSVIIKKVDDNLCWAIKN